MTDAVATRPFADMMASLPFKFAKTMPENPHEYTVRSPETEEAYVALFNMCHAEGRQVKFGKYWYKYFLYGDYDYWPMTTFLPISRIINRAKVKDDDGHGVFGG